MDAVAVGQGDGFEIHHLVLGHGLELGLKTLLERLSMDA